MSNYITLDWLLYEDSRKKQNVEKQNDNYPDILEKIQGIITKNHATELASILYEKSAKVRLKNLINKYLIQEKLVEKDDNLDELSDRIYEDMAGISFIKKYLDDENVEEININGTNGTWIVYPDKKVLIEEKFATSLETINIIKRMARMGNLIVDGSTPIGDSFLRKGIRISVAINPVVDGRITGAIASIRKQKPSFITEERLIEYGTGSKEEIELLKMFINHGVSIGIAGSTGSGKTADMNLLLKSIPYDKRIYTIEDTQELQIEEYDESGKKINDVVQLYTKEPPNAVDMDDLLRLALRFHPRVIVPAEMRGKEAQTAVEAGRTGHTILSTLHANSAKDAYDRILSMYLMGDTPLSEDRILKMIVSAFPIMVYKEQLADGSRKYIEIFEATGVKDGEIIGNTLFSFEPDGVETENGKVLKINGKHIQKNSISKRLRDHLERNGVTKEELSKFYFEK